MSEQKERSEFEERMRALADEQERLELEQNSLRGDAEEALKSIDPQVSEIKDKIRDFENEIKVLEGKRSEIENFIGKLNTKSGHPLRRVQAA